MEFIKEMRRCLFATFSLFIASYMGLNAQERELTLNEKIAINNFIDHVKYERIHAVADQIQYPMVRSAFFDYVIDNRSEFIANYYRLFDEQQVKRLTSANWGYYEVTPYRMEPIWGDGFGGEFNENGVFIINWIPFSNTEKAYIQDLLDADKNSLHPSLRDYEHPICKVLAGKYRIRIDRMNDGRIRYTSWKKNAAISSVPDLVLYGEELRNHWGGAYTFVNDIYEYRISDYIVSFPYFEVSKNGKSILKIETDISIKYY